MAGKIDYGERAAREVSARAGGAVADNAALTAIPASQRVDGMIAITMDTYTLWVFDADSSTAASATVLEPDAGTGRWHRANQAV